MKKKIIKRKLGRGGKYDSIIQLEETHYDDLAEMAAESKGVMDHIERYELTAKEILKKAGLPTDFSKKYDWPDGREGKCSLLSFVKGKELDPEWYAAHILYYANQIRYFVDKGDTLSAVVEAMRLQQKFDYLIFRGMEEAARVGSKNLTGPKSTIYTETEKEAWVVRAKDLWLDPAYRRAGKPNVSGAAKQISEETGNKFETIKKHITTFK